jgi:Protein of unknown function with HXXEE motif
VQLEIFSAGLNQNQWKGAIHVERFRRFSNTGVRNTLGKKFFWFNSGYFVVMIASVVVYDLRGGRWLILPLAWAIERLCNGFWHLWWTIHFREYSPGLVSSILIWMDSYFIVRYGPGAETIAPQTLWGRSHHWTAVRHFSRFLHSSGKRQGDASEGRKVSLSSKS